MEIVSRNSQWKQSVEIVSGNSQGKQSVKQSVKTVNGNSQRKQPVETDNIGRNSKKDLLQYRTDGKTVYTVV